MMLVAVPEEELSAESVRVLVTTKALGKLGAVLHGPEPALPVRIVVGNVEWLWILVTPSSARKATTFNIIGAPRSAAP